MSKEFIVSLDIGTSGCRAAAVRPDGTIAAQRRVALVPHRPQEGLSEYRAQDLWQAARQALHAVLDEAGVQHTAALAVTSQRSTVVLWDKTTGEPVGPVLTWEDGRAVQEAQQAAMTQEEIHARTGLYKTPFFSAPKIAWSLRHVNAAAQLAKQNRLCAAPVASYIIWQLTGGKIFATDITLAQRMLLLDVTALAWDDALCQAFGVPETLLPQVQPSAADYGSYVYRGVAIPLTACVGDQQAAAVYFNLRSGQSLINYGTGAFWLYHTGDKPVFLPGMLTSVAAGNVPAYLLEGPVNAAGSALTWLKAQGIEFEDHALDDWCADAQHPVDLLPAFGGLGAPYWDFKTPTTIGNLSARTRKADWVAGAVRAIAFLQADIAAYLTANGCAVTGPVYVSGGLARSRYLTAFEADVLQCDLAVSHQADATVLGAALLAASGVGMNMDIRPHYTPVSPTLPAETARALYGAWQQFVSRSRQQ